MKKRQTSEEYILESLSRLDFVILETDKILTHFRNREKTDSVLFCFIISERLNHASFALKNLLKEILVYPQLEYSCGIVIRSALLDYMIVLNAMIKISESLDKKEDGVVELDNFCTVMLNECVHYTLRDLVELKIPKESLENIYKNFAKMYAECIETYNDDGSVPIAKTKESYAPGKLFEKIYCNKDFRQYADVYEGYLFYSKYDHFGRMYHDFSNHDLNERIYRINESSKIFPKIIQYVTSILYILNSNDATVKEQFESMQEYIRKH